jgi:hypothetical protein
MRKFRIMLEGGNVCGLALVCFLAACTHLPSSTSHDVSWTAPADGDIGECDAVEFTAHSKRVIDFDFRVELDDDGQPKQFTPDKLSGTDADANALLVARHLFRCRHRLSSAASRMVRYRLHFAPLRKAEGDSLACGAAVHYPFIAEFKGLHGICKVSFGLDENGRVIRAWVDGATDEGFAEAGIDALVHRCAFSPAHLGDQQIPFFDIYTFDFRVK